MVVVKKFLRRLSLGRRESFLAVCELDFRSL